MAITAGPTGEGQVAAATPERFFAKPASRTRPLTTVRVICESTSTAPVQIRIPGLHGTTNWATVKQGETADFRVDDAGLESGYAQGQGGSADFRWFANAST